MIIFNKELNIDNQIEQNKLFYDDLKKLNRIL